MTVCYVTVQYRCLITLGPASTAQVRVWFNERERFQPDKPVTAIYNMPFLFRLRPHHILFVTRLRYALHLIIIKHLTLRTSLTFDTNNNQLIQRINHPHHDDDKNKQLFTFIQSTFDTNQQLIHIMHEEKSNAQLFDLAQGLVFRCHLVHHKELSSNDLLCDEDTIIFNFHHAAFDFPSMNIFLADLHQAYTTGQLPTDDHTTLRYLDCE